jgi:outer membrane protein assembly factor BamB
MAFSVASGHMVWVRRYDSPSGGRDAAAAMAVSRGTVIVAGTATGTTNADIVTITYSVSDGGRRWIARFDSGRADHGAIVAAAESRVFVSGRSKATASGDPVWNYVTRAYSATSGAPAWTAMVDGTAASHNELPHACTSQDGGEVFVTGAAGVSSADMAVVALDSATGGVDWTTTFDGGDSDLPREVVCAPDDARIYVTGMSFDPKSDTWNMATLAFDGTTGAREWRRFYDFQQSDDSGAAAAIDPAGADLFVTGQSGSTFATIAYSAA